MDFEDLLIMESVGLNTLEEAYEDHFSRAELEGKKRRLEQQLSFEEKRITGKNPNRINILRNEIREIAEAISRCKSSAA